jgi:integrase
MLTVNEIKAIKPLPDKIKVVGDEKGLYLEVRPNGAMYWRLKYRFNGKENRLSMGVYPDVGLKDARDARDAARLQLKDGIDPSQARKTKKVARAIAASNTFEALAAEWHKSRSGTWSTVHADTMTAQLKNNILPWLGSRPIDAITADEVLSILQRAESRGANETAKRINTIINAVMNFAVDTERLTRNPAVKVRLRLQSFVPGEHAAITDPQRLGQLMRDMHTYTGSIITRAALQLHALTFQRPNEIRDATWQEFDLDAATWTIPALRMKRKLKDKLKGEPHRVPLSRQAVDVLRDLHPLTGHGAKVFPSERGEGRSISENTARQALRTMGYHDHVPHGFRATARTLIRQQLHFDREPIELQLAHGSIEALGGAYDRTTFMAERTRMMQDWADYLDKLRSGV